MTPAGYTEDTLVEQPAIALPSLLSVCGLTMDAS
jgi:hypothetical protein